MSSGRLPADQRRASIIEAAIPRFAASGYDGTTTKLIAHAAGVNEAILFRHFAGKKQLYLACVDAAWDELVARVDEMRQAERHSRHWRLPGRAFVAMLRERPDVLRVWVRGLVEGTGDAEIDEHLAARVSEAHAFVAELLRHSAAHGGLLDGRDPDVEAWSILAIGMLGATAAPRGLIDLGTFDGVVRAHREWATGDPT